MRVQSLQHNQRGFSLLEAIVALVIFAAVGSALYAWIGTTISGLSRIEAARQEAEAMEVGMAVLETVNPMEQAEGSLRAGHYTVAWQAETLAPVVDGMDPSGNPSLYQVGLYQVLVEITGGPRDVTFDLRRAGWQQVRERQELL